MTMRDNAQDFLERVKRHLPAVIVAAVVYLLALLIMCGWLAGIVDGDMNLISSKSVTMEQLRAMSSMGYWMGRAWFWSLVLAVVLVGILIKAAGEKKVSTGKAVVLAALPAVIVTFVQGWVVVSEAALFKSLLGNWTKLIPLIIIIWLTRKFWPQLKKFFEPKG